MTVAPPERKPAETQLDLARLHPHQVMGITCALCNRYLGRAARMHGSPVRDQHGNAFQLYTCNPVCPPRRRGPSQRPAAGKS
ncbi:hypothetical protein Sm713_00810 [Streptomyces sp. TS71-3]|nr:hypothetical protein Sm713_00810 [Streptomyces sp. TS71-3]